jgi:hypothetical protein
MLQLPHAWSVAAPDSEDPRWALTERIAAAPLFLKAPILRDILLYLAARSITEGATAISEHDIGIAVLRKPLDFDPNQYNIVRVRIRSLRSKLESYFLDEGRDEPVVLTIPKGSYSAHFEPRLPSNGHPSSDTPLPTRSYPRWPLYLALTLLAATALSALLLFPGPVRQSIEAWHTVSTYSFYRDFFPPATPPRATRIVLSNPKLLLYVGSDSPTGTDTQPGRAIPVPPTNDRLFSQVTNLADLGLPYHFLRIADKEFTGLGEASAAFELSRLLQILRTPATLTQTRFLNWDSVSHDYLVMLGSTGVNEWAHKNAPPTDFTFSKFGIRNANPRPGEPALFEVVLEPRSRATVTDYGLIWMFEPRSGSRALMLAGCSSAGTAGVGAFFADPAKMRPVYNALLASSPARTLPSNWQVVLKIHIRDDLPVEAFYLTHRIY